jgi:hypothetical protein
MTDIDRAALADRLVVATVDFHSARIFAIDADPGSAPEHVAAPDPRGYYANVYHRAGNPDGTYEADSDAYWRELDHHLGAAAAIVLLGHGTGKANAAQHLVAWMAHHDSQTAGKIAAVLRADVDDLTDEQVLRLGQQAYGLAPARNHRIG